MTLTILGGCLTPTPGDGKAQDAVYGADEVGRYLGITQAANAAQAADTPPPSAAVEWRWVGGAWTRYRSRDEQALAVEAERDVKIDAGVEWSGRVWYADRDFQQQIAAYLQAYSEGILPADATCDIRAKDKVTYPLTRDEVRQLSATVLAFVQGVYAWSWDQKKLISM